MYVNSTIIIFWRNQTKFLSCWTSYWAKLCHRPLVIKLTGIDWKLSLLVLQKGTVFLLGTFLRFLSYLCIDALYFFRTIVHTEPSRIQISWKKNALLWSGNACTCAIDWTDIFLVIRGTMLIWLCKDTPYMTPKQALNQMVLFPEQTFFHWLDYNLITAFHFRNKLHNQHYELTCTWYGLIVKSWGLSYGSGILTGNSGTLFLISDTETVV